MVVESTVPGPEESSLAGETAVSPSAAPEDAVQLSVVIPALREAPNLAILLPQLCSLLDQMAIKYEIFIVTHDADRETLEVGERYGVQVVEQVGRGYGKALETGFGLSRGRYLLTMDADLSHPPVFIRDLWMHRQRAEIIIASRYVPGGKASMPFSRYLLSLVLNNFFVIGLRLPVHDLSSGFRLYRTELVGGHTYNAVNFDVLPEILVRAILEGYRIYEVPFSYAPREHGSSNARVIPFGIAYLRTFRSLRKLRHSARSHPPPVPRD